MITGVLSPGRFRFVLLLLVSFAAVAGCGTRSGPSGSSVGPIDSLAGTYEIQICSSSCELGDTTRANRLGVLVLNSTTINVNELTQRERRVMGGYFDYELPNLCYVLRDGPVEGDTMAGVDDIGGYTWRSVARPGTDTILLFHLYESSDARYSVEARANGGRFVGTGHSSGSGAVAHSVREHIVGRHIGPPRPQLCLDAVRASLRPPANP